MSVLTPIVDHWDGERRRIYLKTGITNFYPIEDIYHEYRHERRTNESFRKWEPFLRAEGNIPKGGGAFTPRYVVLLDGTKIVPGNDTLQVNQLGDMITNNPDIDPTLYDISELTVPKPIFIKPSEAEIIQLNSESIVYSSFQGAVWVDPASSYDNVGSAAAPNGNRERPVNSMSLAVQIAATRGFKTIGLLGNYVLSSNIEGFEIFGPSYVNTKLIIFDSALTQKASFKKLNIEGVLDGGSEFKDCMVGELHYVNGHIHNTSLYGSILLGGSGDAYFGDCNAADQSNYPVMDMGGSGQNLMMPNYSGVVMIKNLASNSKIIIGLNAGEVILDSNSITAGIINVSGIGLLTDELGAPILSGSWNGATIINSLISRETISQAVWDAQLTSHVINGSTGKAIGTLSTGGVDYQQLADAVWDEPINTHTTAGTFGNFLIKKILTVAKFIGLK